MGLYNREAYIMKIAMFSPLPPKETGIALYTKNLATSLKKHIAIDLFDHSNPHKELMGIGIFDFVKEPALLADLYQYHLKVFHIGNNSEFHLAIYHTLLQKSGVVILHDAVIYYLIAGQDYYSFLRDFSISYGFERIKEAHDIFTSTRGNLMSYRQPQKYPLLKAVLNKAEAVIVHSVTARNIILSYGYTKNVYVIPFLIYDDVIAQSNQIKKEYKYSHLKAKDSELILSILGFIGLTKRIPSVLAALSKIKNQINFKLVIAGMGLDDNIKNLIREFDLQDRIITTGYIDSNQDFFQVMNISDIIINLRYPSMGETSSIVIQGMFLEKSCIVTNYGWFSELPDDGVFKISYDHTEIDALATAILSLSNETTRKIMGQRAKRFILENCHPDQVAKKYVEVFSDIIK